MPIEVAEKQLNILIENFEGPMELLYYLVKKEEYNIYDLPVAKIVDQYIEYINMMKELEFELAGDYLVMAASLLELKARYLLPRQTRSENMDELSPQQELANMIMEYKKYHHLALELEGRMMAEMLSYSRGEYPELKLNDRLIEPNLWELIKSIRKFFVHSEKIPIFKRNEIDIEKRMEEILEHLYRRKRAILHELIEKRNDVQLIVTTFLAILELARIRKVRLLQRRIFGSLWIILLGRNE